MSTLTFQSPGVSVREIDLSFPTGVSPSGIPAGIIGTSVRGPAFVPITFATFTDFVSSFGATDGEKFGPLAMNEWLSNTRAGTFVRVLGVGDGKKRNATTGLVNNAGFVVGSQLVQADGTLGHNKKANPAGSSATVGGIGGGRTYFLGCFMSESIGSTVLSAPGIQNITNVAAPVIRGVVMVPSGVALGLSSSMVSNNTVSLTGSARGQFGSGAAGYDAGHHLGDVVLENGAQDFQILLNGHKRSNSADNLLNVSFDPQKSHYFAKRMNTDPNKIEEFGHYLYTHYDIHSQYAVVTGSGITTEVRGVAGSIEKKFGGGRVDGVKQDSIAFLLTGSSPRNTGVATTATTIGSPNYENFENRFQTAFSPFVISQKFGGKNKNLFRVHARDDGAVGAGAYKIEISNIRSSDDPKDKYGTFTLRVRAFGDTDDHQHELDRYDALSLDPSSANYIARAIGDQHVYYDFDKGEGRQKIVVEGLYPNKCPYVRVEVSSDLSDGAIDATALPMGFRGIHHLVTSGSTAGIALITGSSDNATATGQTHMTTLGISTDELKRAVIPGLPFRESISRGASPQQEAYSQLNWGVQWELKDELNAPNKHEKLVTANIANLVRYFPDNHLSTQAPWVGNNEGKADIDGTILDADRFNNNLFSLERIELMTGSNDRPDPQQWSAARYRRNGGGGKSLTDKDGTAHTENKRFVDPSKDFDTNKASNYLSFVFPLQGGFDGVNIFDKNKARLLDAAVRREMDDSNQGTTTGPTVSAYRKAVDVMESKADVDIQLLAIPGIRHESVTDFAIDAIERRFDAMYVMDIEEQDELAAFITGSTDTIINVGNTTTRLLNRALDTSFAAAYFPDVQLTDPATGQIVQAPPSVAVLGAYGLNDRLAHPWFAPAGFTRGALERVLDTKVRFNRANLDELYSADINPLVVSINNGPIIFGQKTLLAAASALDRVNVRRLLIDVRRKVKSVANTLLFEPNRASTLASFSAAVDPILATIQAQQGIDRFKVTIDTTTTTQTDVENNTIRGKIFLQPTRAVEFISLDFVVTNAGDA